MDRAEGNFAQQYFRPCAVVLLGVFLLLLSWHVADPWTFRHDDNGAWYSATANSHLVKGLAATRGQDFFTTRTENRLVPYLHHPPLLSLYLAGVFSLAGQSSPFVARSAMAFIHLLSFLAFCGVLRRFPSIPAGAKLWALMVFATAPMSTFFGKMPDHEPLGLFFILLGVYAYLRFREAAPGRGLWVFLGAAAWWGVGLSSWHALFLAVGFVFFLFFAERGASRPFAVPSLFCLAASPLLVAVHILWINQWQIDPGQLNSLKHWMSAAPEGKSFWRCLWDAFVYNGRYTGPVPTVFAVFWGLRLLSGRLRGGRLSFAEFFIFSLSWGTLVYNVLFFRAVETHPYQQFYLLPFIALAWGVFAVWLFEKISRHRAVAARFLMATAVFLTVGLGVLYTHVIYSKPSQYAMETAAHIEERYY